MLHWVGCGITVFRVDNPHTKPLPFWEWLIAEVRREHPDVIFLSEAFTRPAPMTALAKAGFAQSYTYFTWKNTRWELLEFLGQLLDWRDFYRPNCFANTPDILHEYLQNGGRPAFEARLVLAATLSPSYGIYSGFEHCENVPVRPGSEEYLDSEKYELKRRKLDGPLLPLAAKLNAARRENPALQWLDPLTILETENEHLFAFLKRRGDNTVVTVVNLDPRRPRSASASCPSRPGSRRPTRCATSSRAEVDMADRPQLRQARPRPEPRAKDRRLSKGEVSSSQVRCLTPDVSGEAVSVRRVDPGRLGFKLFWDKAMSPRAMSRCLTPSSPRRRVRV